MELLQHLLTYHAVHIIGVFGIIAVMEYDRITKKKEAKRQALNYLRM